MFAVKLANFLIFTVSAVKCLEGSSDIFGNGQTSSLLIVSLRNRTAGRRDSKTHVCDKCDGGVTCEF